MALLEGEGKGARLIDEVVYGPPHKQSELLPGVIDDLLEKNGRRISDLKGMKVGLGPGSFTGLRIGIATAKGLCYAGGIPLTGASSLAALALEASERASSKEL